MNAWVADPAEAGRRDRQLVDTALADPGVPARLAVPLPLSTQVRPCGRAPASVSAGTGAPVALTVKLKPEPVVAVALSAVVIVGAPVTIRTNSWVVVPPVFGRGERDG